MQMQLNQINTRVSFVEKSTNKLLRFDIADIFKPLSRYTQADAVVASCVMSSSALLLFVAISLLIQLTKKKSLPSLPREKYDIVINKEDEIAAKLNLARAYIDMGKNDESRTIIDEVIAHGDFTQKTEAEELLAKIKQN
jgi:FimV-like protein